MNARIILHDRAAKINNDGPTTEIFVKDKHIPINITNGVGPKGDDGNGIVSIQKTETTGLTDTYVITYTNGDTEEFTIENGNGIAGIEKTGTDGLIDTYQITYTDPNKEADIFTVHNGERGDKGDSPEKGVDYWTAEDKAELAQEASELIDLTPYAERTEVPVESGTGLGSVKTKDFEYDGTTKSNIASGRASFAEGISTQATGAASHAEGGLTRAWGSAGSHAEGANTIAAGNSSHAEGTSTYANGRASHAEGQSTTAVNACSHAEGNGTYAQGLNQHAQGTYNAVDTGAGVFADIVGNGSDNTHRSNAFALTWTGDGRYAGDVYVDCDPDSTGGTKLAKITDIPEVPVQDVQVNGTSILDNSIANVPVASTSNAGVIKIANDTVSDAMSHGGTVLLNDTLLVVGGSFDSIKAGSDLAAVVSAARQHNSVFYGLAKAAGVDMKDSNNQFGVYTDEAKLAIRTMLGLDDTSIVNIVQAGLPAAEGVAW